MYGQNALKLFLSSLLVFVSSNKNCIKKIKFKMCNKAYTYTDVITQKTNLSVGW